jgi:hypothetical protein
MTVLTSLAKALAVESGRAQPVRTVRHVHLSDRPLVFIPLQLAGEACAPLAALVGDDRDKPQMLTVYEPRNRTERFQWAASLASRAVLPFIEAHVTGELGEKETYPDAPQILVPNLAGVKFTRLLGRSTRFRRTEGEWAVPPAVPLLGRWLTYYAERSDYPGSSLLLPMTRVLRDHWATGQSATEDQNLAALLGWIDPPPGKSGHEAAREAEDPDEWPPAGPATDPVFDAEVLEGLIKAVRDAAASGSGARLDRARAMMEHHVRTQLAPTWDLMWQAVDLLRELPAGGSVTGRWESDRWSFSGTVRYVRDGGPPQAKRDSAVSAARRLAQMERDLNRLEVGMAYDDPLVMAEYRMTGQAFQGRVVEADPARIDDSGRRGKLRPVVVIETGDETSLEKDAKVVSPAYPKQSGVVLNRAPVDAGTIRLTVELSGGMGQAKVAPQGTMPSVGDTVLYTTLVSDPLRREDLPAVEFTPWTHGGPPPEYVPNDDDANESWE